MRIRPEFYCLSILGIIVSACVADDRKRPELEDSGDTDGESGIVVDVSGDLGSNDNGDTDTNDTLTPIDPSTTTDSDTEGDTDMDTGPSNSCGDVMVSLAVPPPNVMLVLDKSGSMVSNSWDHDADSMTADQTRWHSLYSVVDSITTSFNDTINFGAQLFPSKAAVAAYSFAACVTETEPEVAVAAQNRTAVMAAIPAQDATNMAISGGTPASVGMQSAMDSLVGITTPGSKAIILVTDGAANCNASSAECMADIEDPVCHEQMFENYDDRLPITVENAFMMHGIPTYVVGIDIIDDDDLGKGQDGVPHANPFTKLNELAVAGGVPNADPDKKFFNTKNEDELNAALTSIAGEIQTCFVPLNEAPNVPPEPEQVRYVSFTIDDVEVPFMDGATSCDGVDGWRWTNSDGPYEEVELCGTWCTKLKEATMIDGKYGCPPPE